MALLQVQPFAAEYSLKIAGESGVETGECAVTVTGPGFELTPRGMASMAVRFAEIKCWQAVDYRFCVALDDGTELEIMKLARRFDEFADLFRASRQEHFLAALLLEEGEQSAAASGAYDVRDAHGAQLAAGSCSILLQQTSLACFPDRDLPFLVPYGAMLELVRDEELYGARLSCDDGSVLNLSRFARRTDEILADLEERRAALARRQSAALAALMPEVGAIPLRRCAALLRDGVPAGREQLEAAAPGGWEALWQNGFSAERRPYAELLLGMADTAFVVLKETGPWGVPEDVPAALADRRLLYLFRIDGALVVEAPSTDDAATYIFRSCGDLPAFVRTICRALAAIQFRREPVYLPLAAMTTPPNDRYAEAVRLLPPLVAARQAFVGRAIHTSVASWQSEIDAAVAACRA